MRIVVILLIVVEIRCDRTWLERADAHRWRVKEFSAERVRLDLPYDAKVDHDPTFGVTVSLHPMKSLPVLEDVPYLITVHCEIESRKKLLQNSLESDRYLKGMPGKEWQLWMDHEHPSIDRTDDGDYSYYRYDHPCSSQIVVHSNAEVRHPTVRRVPQYVDEDDMIVRRILGSAKCLGLRNSRKPLAETE